MLKLYGAPLTRSSMIQWYLEELGVPYEYVALDYQSGSFRNPPSEFFTANPMGKTPTIVDGNFNLWESGAILLYLAEKYDQLPESLEQRALIYKWLFFASATLDPFVLIDPAKFTAEGREQQIDRFMLPINQTLEHQSFIVGDKFTVADVSLGLISFFMKEFLKLNLTAYPAILNYLQRLTERPAFQNILVAQVKAMSEG